MQLLVAGVDFRQVQATAVERFHVSVVVGLFANTVHVFQHAGIALEIAVNILLCLVAAHIQLAAKAKGGHAINESEVDGLGAAALVAGDVVDGHAKDFGSRRPVNVLALFERLEQSLVARQVRHDAQFNLGVVRRHQLVALRGHESLANAPALFAADGNVLQVRLRGRQPAGGRYRLVIGGVNPASAMVNQFRQGVGVGGFQLAQAAVLKDQSGQGMLVGQFLQHRFRRGGRAFRGFLYHRQPHLVVENGL